MTADPESVTTDSANRRCLLAVAWSGQSASVESISKHDRPGGYTGSSSWRKALDVSISDRIHAMNLLGIVVKPDERRVRTGADSTANLIAFTRADNAAMKGVEEALRHASM